jgi:hypothetical protein
LVQSGVHSDGNSGGPISVQTAHLGDRPTTLNPSHEKRSSLLTTSTKALRSQPRASGSKLLCRFGRATGRRQNTARTCDRPHPRGSPSLGHQRRGREGSNQTWYAEKHQGGGQDPRSLERPPGRRRYARPKHRPKRVGCRAADARGGSQGATGASPRARPGEQAHHRRTHATDTGA